MLPLASPAFNRRYRFDIGPAASVGRRYSDLQFTFDIKQDTDEEPNVSTFTIFNLNPDSRGWIQAIANGQVSFSAGYGDSMSLLFQGDVAQVRHEKDDTDWRTVVEAGDGEVAYRDGHISLSRAPGATRRSILESAAAELGLGLYVSASGDTADFLDAPYTEGVSFHGAAQDLIRRLARGSGREWSIQNAMLQLIHEGGATNLPAVRLSASTGLIGTPKPAKQKIQLVGGDRRPRAGESREEEPGVTVSSLLNPLLRPGQLVQLESLAVSGIFVVRSAHHTGDYRGDKWNTEAELGSVARDG